MTSFKTIAALAVVSLCAATAHAAQADASLERGPDVVSFAGMTAREAQMEAETLRQEANAILSQVAGRQAGDVAARRMQAELDQEFEADDMGARRMQAELDQEFEADDMGARRMQASEEDLDQVVIPWIPQSQINHANMDASARRLTYRGKGAYGQGGGGYPPMMGPSGGSGRRYPNYAPVPSPYNSPYGRGGDAISRANATYGNAISSANARRGGNAIASSDAYGGDAIASSSSWRRLRGAPVFYQA